MSFCHSWTEATPSPTAAGPTPRYGIVTLRKTPAFASSAISRSILVEELFSASTCAIVTKGGSRRRKFKTSAILVEFIPAFSGKSLNIRLRMYSMYWGTSRKLRSEAREATIPISSSCSSSSKDIEVSDGRDLLRGFAADGEDVVLLNPRAAAALCLCGVLIREERAGVAWSDIFPLIFLYTCSEGRDVLVRFKVTGNSQSGQSIN